MKEIGEVLRQAYRANTSPEAKAYNREIGQHLYLMGRWTLGAVLHPIATFQAVMLIGDQDRINRNVDRALRLPKLPLGRERLRS